MNRDPRKDGFLIFCQTKQAVPAECSMPFACLSHPRWHRRPLHITAQLHTVRAVCTLHTTHYYTLLLFPSFHTSSLFLDLSKLALITCKQMSPMLTNVAECVDMSPMTISKNIEKGTGVQSDGSLASRERSMSSCPGIRPCSLQLRQITLPRREISITKTQ